MRRVLVALALAACSGHPGAEHRAPVAVHEPAPLAGTGPSIYDLDVALRGPDGAIKLDIDRGHPTLVSMFYASCPAACPALIDEVDRVLREVRPDTRVLLVSFDPARDTPERLRELARIRHLDARWTLAAADDADARTLAAVLGIRYRVLASGEFFHTSAIVALDADGRPVARMDGLGAHAGLVTALR